MSVMKDAIAKRHYGSITPSPEAINEFTERGFKIKLPNPSQKVELLQLPKGVVQHDKKCSSVRFKPKAVKTEFSLMEAAKARLHTCVRLNWVFRFQDIQTLWNAEAVRVFIAELEALESHPQPAHNRLADLRWALNEDDFKNYAEAVGLQAQVDEWNARVNNLEAAWGKDDLASSFIISNLSWPRTLVKGYEGKGLGRFIAPAWDSWSSEVAQEKTSEEALKAGKAAWSRALKLAASRGEQVDVPQEMEAKVFQTFQRVLKKANKEAAEGVWVLLAYSNLSHYWGRAQDEIDQVGFSYGAISVTSKASGGMRWCVIVPEAVAEWLTGRVRSALWMGEFSKDDKNVADTFVRLWEPTNIEGAFQSAQEALSSAWALT